MKALLLTLMFLISMTAFCQQKSSREVGVTVLKDSSNILKDCSIVVSKENLMLSQSVIVDHHGGGGETVECIRRLWCELITIIRRFIALKTWLNGRKLVNLREEKQERL